MSSDSPTRDPAIRVATMPHDTNVHGTVFGGVILSHIDQAGAIAARPWANDRVVTVAMKEVKFLEPVFVGDIVSYYTKLLNLGRTSITVEVCVEAERFSAHGQKVRVTDAVVTYVSVNAHGEKTALRGDIPRPATPQA